MKRVCIIGCGAIGSLYAAHLARVTEVWCFVRREEHAQALNLEGLSVSGRHKFRVALKATTRPDELPDCDLGIVATKATQVAESIAPVGAHFDNGVIISAQNGLGSEEIIAEHTRGQVIRGTTFMSGTKHSDTQVQYELDTATWIGPCKQHNIDAMTNHPPSMLYDVRRQLPTELDFLSGAIAREAKRVGVAAPLHTAVHRLIKGKEAAWTFKDENCPVAIRRTAH